MKKSTKLIIGIISAIAIICVTVVLVFAGTGKETSEYEKYIEASQKYVDELSYEKAIAELELAIEIEPNNAEAYIALAEVYEKMGDSESAISVLEKAKEKVDDVSSVIKALEKISKQGEEPETDNANVTDTSNRTDDEPIDLEMLSEIIREGGRTEVWETGTYGTVLQEAYFDSEDKLIYSIQYGYEDDDENIEWYCIYEYNEYAEEVKFTRYAADNTYEGFGTKEYNEDHKIIEEIYCDGSGNVTDMWTHEYDTNGNKIKMTHSVPDKMFVWICEYDESGNVIREYQQQ